MRHAHAAAGAQAIVGAIAAALLFGCATPGGTQLEASPATREAVATSSATPKKRSVPQGKTRAVTSREQQAIEDLMQAAQVVRGLRFARDVPVMVQDPDAIMSYVESQIDEGDLQRSQAIYVALGLLAPDLDVHKLLVRLMGEQIVGYYDVDHGSLVVRDDVMRAFSGLRTGAPVNLAEARVVLVHELVHALQDQRLGLSEQIDKKRDSDADSAFRSLIEGDATLAMIGYSLQRESVPLSEITTDPARIRSLSEVVRSSPLAGSELGTAPAIVREPLLSSYVDGLLFVANLHGDGGFSRINRVHADPPQSTEQVLHPERFVHRDVPQHVRLQDPANELGSGYSLWHEDTLGELETRIYFAQGCSEEVAARAARGWGGDRIYLYRTPSGQTAVVWLSTWDDGREADEAQAAAEQMVIPTRPNDFVLRSGTALLIARGVPAELQSDVRQRFASWAQNRGTSPHETN